MPAAASSNFVFRIGYSSRQRPLPFWAGLRRHRAFARNIGTAHESASSANDVLAPQAGTKFKIPLAKSVRSVASPALGIRGGNHDQDKVDFHRGCVCGRDVSGRGREETERCTEDSRDAASRRSSSSAEVEAGKACKAEADAKGLHEEPRKVFRKACMRAAIGKPTPIKSADGAARPATAEQR